VSDTTVKNDMLLWLKRMAFILFVRAESPEAKVHRLRRELQLLVEGKQNTERRLKEMRASLRTICTHNKDLAHQLASGCDELKSRQRELQDMESW